MPKIQDGLAARKPSSIFFAEPLDFNARNVHDFAAFKTDVIDFEILSIDAFPYRAQPYSRILVIMEA